MPPFNDLIIKTLRAANRNPKLKSQFLSILAKSRVYVLLNNERRPWTVTQEVDGAIQEFSACFSSSTIAKLTWQKISVLKQNQGRAALIRPVHSLRLFFDASLSGLPVYLNFKNYPDESYCFPISAVKDFLYDFLRPSPSMPSSADIDPHRDLRRSKQGRNIVHSEVSKAPISEVDFEMPMTKQQIAAIFEVSENEIARQLSMLTEKKIVDVGQLSISIDSPDSRKNIIYYDPVIAFHVGYQLKGMRGEDFRQWLIKLVYEFFTDKATGEVENSGLKDKLEAAEDMVKTQAEALNARDLVLDDLQRAIGRGNQTLLAQTAQIADLKKDLNACGSWDLPESVMEAKRMAAVRYGSTLIFHERVDQTIADFQLNENLYAAFTAANIFKALAEILHLLKFDQPGFSEEKFNSQTRFILSMTESKASKNHKAIEDSRTCIYEGRAVYFYPHIKAKIQGVDFRVYFQFLDDKKKILICHVGKHLPNAMTQHLQ